MNAYKLIQLSTAAVFIGRGFQYCFRDAPLRVVLWEEDWMSHIVKALGYTWESYATSPNTEANIAFFIKIIGILYFLAGFGVFFYEKIREKTLLKKIVKTLVAIGIINLLFLAFCYMKDNFYHFGQFFEYAIQIGAPILFLFYEKINHKTLIISIKIISALTFICHGLYAMNYYTTPVDYTSMTMNGFRMDESTAKQFLYIIGIIDVMAAIMLFLPKMDKIALWYMVVWGFLTSVARIYGYWYDEVGWAIVQQYWFHSLYRFGHFLIPLAGLYSSKEKPLSTSIS